ncbi:MAG: ECF transporter S component [Absicoccus porci]|uniref:Riboflavin transporter n=2 Tax=Absicoccus TaxID=2718525 RepID=A0ABU4WKI9_9FIRM|nr:MULTISPECIES: ECF transporter S component [Absicoccus]MDD6459456.1 ECF transporter S component [Absicoccus porci]MDX8417079.1 ECF transporter S component [Absicoccus sp. CLA-KB-P134]
MKNWNVKKLVFTAMLTAVAGVLMSLEISVPLMPVFYKIDFSDVPTVIALFTMGPLSATMVEIIKILIKVLTVGTNTAYVGELANVLGVAVFVIPTWIVYTKMGKTNKAIFASLVIGVLVRTAWACFCNAYITLPLYAKAMSMNLNDVIKAVSFANGNITNLRSFIMLATIPFNIIKISLNYIIGYVVYDHVVLKHTAFKVERHTA